MLKPPGLVFVGPSNHSMYRIFFCIRIHTYSCFVPTFNLSYISIADSEVLFGSVTKATVPSVRKDKGRTLRYPIGYVCRHLRKKIEEQNHELKEEPILCLVSLLKASDNEEECGTDEDWVKAQDRGGLLYVKETMYSLFLSIEGELRERLQALTGLEVRT